MLAAYPRCRSQFTSPALRRASRVCFVPFAATPRTLRPSQTQSRTLRTSCGLGKTASLPQNQIYASRNPGSSAEAVTPQILVKLAYQAIFARIRDLKSTLGKSKKLNSVKLIVNHAKIPVNYPELLGRFSGKNRLIIWLIIDSSG
jgi:hypothetical protein